MLTGETKGRPDGERVPMNVDEEVRGRLRLLLYRPEMRGVGYSEFLDRAIAAAHAEIDEGKTSVRRFGHTVSVEITDYEFGDSTSQAMITVNIDPPHRGLDVEAYNRIVKKIEEVD